MSAALAYPLFEAQHTVAVMLHMPAIRHCAMCRLPIPAKRLLAIPEAKLCVGCLTETGDVPVIRRFDELTPDGERVGSYFTNDQYIEQQMRRVNSRGLVSMRVNKLDCGSSSTRTLTAVPLGRAVYEQAVEEHRELSEARKK